MNVWEDMFFKPASLGGIDDNAMKLVSQKC